MGRRQSPRRRRLRWSRIIPAVFCFLLSLLAAGIIFALFHEEEADGKPVSAPAAVSASGTDSSVPEERPERELSGTVRDALMSTLVLETDAGEIYEFDIGEAEISARDRGILIGDQVTVHYSGDLDPKRMAQTVSVRSVVVEEEVSGSAAEQAVRLLADMTCEEKVGQMFFVRCPAEDAAQKAADYHLGGYILFGQDFAGKTAEQAAQDIQRCQEAVSLPLLIGVDEEGGAVNRISLNPAFRSAPFLSPQELYRQGGFEAVRSDTREKCRLLRSLGIQVNLAPVCDVSENPEDFIYERAFGRDAAQTARYVQTVVEVMQEERMGSVLKHFPGYGNNSDTHTGLAYDNRSCETFRSSDFLPFEAGIAAGAEMVLVSHNIVSCMDGRFPASLSPEVHRVLREELGFTGVILTDDLYMQGVRDFVGDEEAAVLAVEAGNDMLCCTDFETQIPAVLRAVREGRIPESRLDESVLRILEMKISLGLL